MTNIPEYEEFCDAYLVRARIFSSQLVPNDNRRDRQSLTDRINVVILMFRYQQLPNQQQQSAMIPSGVHWIIEFCWKCDTKNRMVSFYKSRNIFKRIFSKNLCFENNRSSGGKVRRWLPEFIAWVSAILGWAARRRWWECWKKNSWNCQISWRCLQGWNFKFFLSDNSSTYCIVRNRKIESSS